MPTRRILAPLDNSSLGESKLPIIEEYGRAFGAEVILLHVLPERHRPELPLPRRGDHGAEEGQVSPEEARARTYLDACASRLRAAGIVASPLVRGGPVAETILDVARREGATLIILGSDVRRGLPRLFLGSIAGAIERDAPCPILLIRPDATATVTIPEVRSFADDTARAGLLTPRVLGLRSVDLARIIGSVGRAAETGANFRPLDKRLAEEQRYQRILALTAEGTRPMPPVDLYKLGYGYYVVDGHRRVAAAKELGYSDIPANVTEFVPATDADAQHLFTARRTFERATGLTSVGAARPESYPRLEAMIEEFRRARGLADPREAALRWRASVYGDLVRRIRALHLNRYFPGERSADIVVRVDDHRRAESDRLGRELTWDEALLGFAAQL